MYLYRTMTDTTRTLVVGMMQTPPYDRMFESARRVYSAKGLCPDKWLDNDFFVIKFN